MKTVVLALSLVLTASTASATLVGSKLNPRHQALLEQAAVAQCGQFRGEVVEISTVATPIHVDQGITDYEYVTELEVRQRIDQMMYDTYSVTVKSLYFDGYDHAAQDWGMYRVENVSACVQK